MNGSAGIAVGMATNIPPHNLNEIVSACLAIDRQTRSIDVPELIKHVCPDPISRQRGIINGAARASTRPIAQGAWPGLHAGQSHVYRGNGQGAARAHRIVTELPYQVNKARLIEKIADLVREKKIEGIAQDGLRDESDKDGMRIVIELKRGEVGRRRC